VDSGGSASLAAGASDSHPGHDLNWSWSDGGAGGTFLPSVAVPSPTYVAPANCSDQDLAITLSVTVSCSGPESLSDTQTTTLAVRPIAHTATVVVLPPDPPSVDSGGSAQLDAGLTDSREGHVAAQWLWGDGGAGGSFVPSADVAAPVYTAPANLTDGDVSIALSVTGTCSGLPALSDTQALALLVRPVAHSLSLNVPGPSPATVDSGGSTSLVASASDSRTGHAMDWAWSDGGAGGTFLPSAAVAHPTYTAPANTADHDLTVTLSVTVTCSGSPPLDDTKATTLTVRPSTPLIFGEFREPINADGSSVFKAGRTIPVKIVLTDASGSRVVNATARLSYWRASGSIIGTVPEGFEPVWPDTGYVFRYAADDQQYIYNLSTKGMPAGTYLLRVTVDGYPGFHSDVLVGWK
jgi:hypothetical protein